MGKNNKRKTNLINGWKKRGEGYFLREINKRGGWVKTEKIIHKDLRLLDQELLKCFLAF